jgi:MtN3 and saliva related transmembrane protein
MELWIGYAGAFCTTISFLPQVYKVLKEKDASSLSLSMYLIFTFGVCLWLIYGLLKNDPVIIIANIITLLFASIILISKIRYDYFSENK